MSDVRYASRVYVDRLRSMGVTPSMSRKGNPYDNARMKSFYETLKSKEVDLQDYLDLDRRPATSGPVHWVALQPGTSASSLGYIPPVESTARSHSA